MGLGHDELVHVFEFFNESDYLDLRRVCRTWNQAVESSLTRDSPHILVRTRKYLSAIKLMNAPRVCRRGIPLHPTSVLREACITPHCGIIKYVLDRFKDIKRSRVFNAIVWLWTNGITHANVCAAVIFYQHGFGCRGFTLQHAITHDSIELARFLPCQETIQVKYIKMIAVRGDIEFAQVIRAKIKSIHGMSRIPDDKFRKIRDLNFDVAMIFAKFASGDMKVILYDNILNEHAAAIKYHEVIREIKPDVIAHKEKVARDAAIEGILVTVKKTIVRGLRRVYPEINDPAHDIQIKFNLTHADMMRVKWDLPWNYSYEIAYGYVDGKKVISQFYIAGIYNVSSPEKEMRKDNTDCIVQ
jgi:hypothetical protein